MGDVRIRSVDGKGEITDQVWNGPVPLEVNGVHRCILVGARPLGFGTVNVRNGDFTFESMGGFETDETGGLLMWRQRGCEVAIGPVAFAEETLIHFGLKAAPVEPPQPDPPTLDTLDARVRQLERRVAALEGKT